MRLILAVVVLAALSPAANADPLKPIRVIEITKENAERSAADIAAAKSPLVGMPPTGRTVRTASEWPNARAELPEDQAVRVDDPMAESFAKNTSGRTRVQIIKPGKTGPVVETYLVPSTRR